MSRMWGTETSIDGQDHETNMMVTCHCTFCGSPLPNFPRPVKWSFLLKADFFSPVCSLPTHLLSLHIILWLSLLFLLRFFLFPFLFLHFTSYTLNSLLFLISLAISLPFFLSLSLDTYLVHTIPMVPEEFGVKWPGSNTNLLAPLSEIQRLVPSSC